MNFVDSIIKLSSVQYFPKLEHHTYSLVAKFKRFKTKKDYLKKQYFKHLTLLHIWRIELY